MILLFKNIFVSRKGPHVEQTLSQLIRIIRFYRGGVLFGSIFIVVFTTITYLLLISPIFQPTDLANPLVQELFLSKDYAEVSDPYFKRLKAFNARRPGEDIELPSELISLFNHRGLILTTRMTPSPEPMRSEGQGVSSDRVGLTQYRYEYTHVIRIDTKPLFFFAAVLLLSLLLACIALASMIGNRRREENLLDEEWRVAVEEVYGQRTELTVGRDELEGMLTVLRGFHTFAKQINIRREQRATIVFNDEYDVQDALRALFRSLTLDIVRPEEPTPSVAGKSARIDFLLSGLKTAVEVKKTRSSMSDRSLGEELIVDITRYRAHPNCAQLVFFIYDPDEVLTNAPLLISDIQSLGSAEFRVLVLVSPQYV